METSVNLDRVWPERVAGYGTNYVGQGWLEKTKGRPVHGSKMRALVILSDGDAQKVLDWMLDNPGHAYPFSFTETNRIVGVELVGAQLAPI